MLNLLMTWHGGCTQTHTRQTHQRLFYTARPQRHKESASSAWPAEPTTVSTCTATQQGTPACQIAVLASPALHRPNRTNARPPLPSSHPQRMRPDTATLPPMHEHTLFCLQQKGGLQCTKRHACHPELRQCVQPAHLKLAERDTVFVGPCTGAKQGLRRHMYVQASLSPTEERGTDQSMLLNIRMHSFACIRQPRRSHKNTTLHTTSGSTHNHSCSHLTLTSPPSCTQQPTVGRPGPPEAVCPKPGLTACVGGS